MFPPLIWFSFRSQKKRKTTCLLFFFPWLHAIKFHRVNDARLRLITKRDVGRRKKKLNSKYNFCLFYLQQWIQMTLFALIHRLDTTYVQARSLVISRQVPLWARDLHISYSRDHQSSRYLLSNYREKFTHLCLTLYKKENWIGILEVSWKSLRYSTFAMVWRIIDVTHPTSVGITCSFHVVLIT